jgi:hypothetical protein
MNITVTIETTMGNTLDTMDNYENNEMYLLCYPDDNVATGQDCVHFNSYDEMISFIELYNIQYYSYEVI